VCSVHVRGWNCSKSSAYIVSQSGATYNRHEKRSSSHQLWGSVVIPSWRCYSTLRTPWERAYVPPGAAEIEPAALKSSRKGISFFPTHSFQSEFLVIKPFSQTFPEEYDRKVSSSVAFISHLHRERLLLASHFCGFTNDQTFNVVWWTVVKKKRDYFSWVRHDFSS